MPRLDVVTVISSNMVCDWKKVILLGLAALSIPVISEEMRECKAGEWRCGDRSCAGVGAACDGALQCEDGSDESLALCKGTKRPLLGLLLLCVEPWTPLHLAVCPEACRKWPEYCHYALAALHREPGTCVFPPFPSVGSYSITDITPRGANLADFSLTYFCPAEYRLLGKKPRCVGGVWSAGFPSCIPASSSAVSAIYAFGNHSCMEWQFPCADGACVGLERRCDGAPDCADGSDERACADGPKSKMCVLPKYPEHGSYSVVDQPLAAPGQAYPVAELVVTCSPDYEVIGSTMVHCRYGAWSNEEMPLCSQCGTATHGRIPWHAGIYDKRYRPYVPICGGSLVSTTVVISAAHCFSRMETRLQPVSNYGVALGKIYRPWDEPRDNDVHKSDVKNITIPNSYIGSENQYKDDLALVILVTPVDHYSTHIRPVCLDFRPKFDRIQLDTSVGKVVGWGWTSGDGHPSAVLKIMQILHVGTQSCRASMPEYFRRFITSEKICGEAVKEPVICKGDSGGGLAYPTVDSRGTQRYYLRGVVSTAPSNKEFCKTKGYTFFTHILAHEMFMKSIIQDVIFPNDDTEYL